VWLKCLFSSAVTSHFTYLKSADAQIQPPSLCLKLLLPRAKWLGNFRHLHGPSHPPLLASLKVYQQNCEETPLWERKSQGVKVPGTKWPGSELARVLLADSLQGSNWFQERKGSVPSFCTLNDGQSKTCRDRLTVKVPPTHRPRIDARPMGRCWG